MHDLTLILCATTSTHCNSLSCLKLYWSSGSQCCLVVTPCILHVQFINTRLCLSMHICENAFMCTDLELWAQTQVLGRALVSLSKVHNARFSWAHPALAASPYSCPSGLDSIHFMVAPPLRRLADCACGQGMVHHASGCFAGCFYARWLAQ